MMGPEEEEERKIPGLAGLLDCLIDCTSMFGCGHVRDDANFEKRTIRLNIDGTVFLVYLLA